MKKLVSVICPELDRPHSYLTSGKTYEIFNVLDDNFGNIIDDEGDERTVFLITSSHIEDKSWILNYEPDTTERSREIVSNLLLREFNAMPDTCDEELIQAAKDFGFDELANEMEKQIK